MFKWKKRLQQGDNNHDADHHHPPNQQEVLTNLAQIQMTLTETAKRYIVNQQTLEQGLLKLKRAVPYSKSTADTSSVATKDPSSSQHRGNSMMHRKSMAMDEHSLLSQEVLEPFAFHSYQQHHQQHRLPTLSFPTHALHCHGLSPTGLLHLQTSLLNRDYAQISPPAAATPKLTTNHEAPVAHHSVAAAADTATTTANVSATDNATVTAASPEDDKKTRAETKKTSLKSSTNQKTTALTASSTNLARYKYPSEALELTKGQIENAMEDDSAFVFQIFDRRINLDSFDSEASLYSLLRAWVQDDPYRQMPPPGSNLLEYVSLSPQPRFFSSSPSSHSLKRTKGTSKQRPKIDMISALVQQQSLSTTSIRPRSIASLRDDLRKRAKATKHKKRKRHKIQQANAIKALKQRGITLPHHPS